MRYYAIDTDVGAVREQNEDAIGVVERSNFLCLIICDGMGGHEAGDVASQMAVEELQKYFSFDDAIQKGEEAAFLEEALLKANDRINYAAEKQNLNGMGATAVVALLVKDDDKYRLTIGYAGDSRAYIFACGPSGDAKILPITRDHNVYNDATQPELVPEEEREYLTQVLGGGNTVQPTINRSFDIPTDAVLLLCSDGLYDMLHPEEMLEIIAGKTVEQGVFNLIQEANYRHSRDNISVALFKHGETQILLPELAIEEDFEEPSDSQKKMTPRNTEVATSRRGARDSQRNPPRNRARRQGQPRVSGAERKRANTANGRTSSRASSLGQQSEPAKSSLNRKSTSVKKSSNKNERQLWVAILILIWIPILFFVVKKIKRDEEQEQGANNIQSSSLEKTPEEKYEEFPLKTLQEEERKKREEKMNKEAQAEKTVPSKMQEEMRDENNDIVGKEETLNEKVNQQVQENIKLQNELEAKGSNSSEEQTNKKESNLSEEDEPEPK